jgi:excisionase family DNA binding protein
VGIFIFKDMDMDHVSTPHPDEVYLASGQAAHLLKISSTTIRRWVQDGLIQPQAQTPGGHFRFRLSYVRRIALRLQSAGAAAPSETETETDTAAAGQSLTEFALVLPLLLLIILGAFAFGNFFRQHNAMNNAASAGAFYASLGHNEAEVQAYVRQALTEQLVDPQSVEIALAPRTYNYGDSVTVALTKTMVLDAIWWRQTFALPVRSTQIIQKQVTP